MTFDSFIYNSNVQTITATAKGHPTNVVEAFREACTIIFRNQGPWRIVEVSGLCRPETALDSEMMWSLRAERKVDHLLRTTLSTGAPEDTRNL